MAFIFGLSISLITIPSEIAAAMNTALYLMFTVSGCLGGMLFNIFGNKLLLIFGGLSYISYAVSVYAYGQNAAYGPLAIFFSGLLGVGAGALWTAQGAMTLSYSTEDKKGLFTATFWIIFNLGGVVGGLLTMYMNYGSEGAGGVNAHTYFMFCGIMFLGVIFAAILIVHPSKVIRADGQYVRFDRSAKPSEEIRSVLNLFTNRYMVLLTPLILSSNWFYAYDFGGINGNLFDAETRGLNSALFWSMQMIGSYVLGAVFLDSKSMGRRKRAIWGVIVVSVITLLHWVYALYYQRKHNYDKGNQPSPLINFTHGLKYAVPATLYMFMGLVDACIQTYAYWILGAIANSPTVLSRYAGYYKGMQSLGACLSWMLEWMEVSYLHQLYVCIFWAVVCIPPTCRVAMMVKDRGTSDEIEKGATYMD